MITIENNDLPITAAEKIITGTKPRDENAFSKFLRVIAEMGGDDDDALETVDMFSLEDIEEIAHYLILYCEAHKNGD